jgi:uncharacterized membrane protein
MKGLHFLLSLPFIGLSSIYFYVLISMIAINSTAFYKFNPKDTPVNFVYDFVYPLPAIGHLGTLLGCIILVIDYIKYKGKLTSSLFKWIYYLGVALTLFLHYVDLGYCQIWFFD